ncbi:hypothetical protein L1049_004155 [Liquidambar formosana]|uniref:Uncharacterized protein n=1 Tax=Liquidambar formosana TaxID=63359 RepID=A0AAP0WVF1_LIQFO
MASEGSACSTYPDLQKVSDCSLRMPCEIKIAYSKPENFGRYYYVSTCNVRLGDATDLFNGLVNGRLNCKDEDMTDKVEVASRKDMKTLIANHCPKEMRTRFKETAKK